MHKYTGVTHFAIVEFCEAVHLQFTCSELTGRTINTDVSSGHQKVMGLFCEMFFSYR